MLIEELSVKISEKLVEENNKDLIEEVSYGICATLTSMINLILCGISSYLLNIVDYFLIFILIFIPIRINHKGFHCLKFSDCLLTTNILFSLFSLLCSLSIGSIFVYLALITNCIHYFISSERNKKIFLIITTLLVITYLMNLNIQHFLFWALLLDTILILGGKK